MPKRYFLGLYAEAEAILRRFTRSGPQHPTYQALAEYGKVPVGSTTSGSAFV